MATQVNQQNTIALTATMFNAAPGASNLADFKNYATLEELADGLEGTSAFRSQFYGLETLDAKLQKVLTHNLSLEEGSQAYNEAMSFFMNGINAGRGVDELFVEVTNYLTGGSVEPQFAQAAQALQNKIDVATYYSVEQGRSAASLDELQSVIAPVTADPTTVEAAQAAINGNYQLVTGQMPADDSYTLGESQEAIRFLGIDSSETKNVYGLTSDKRLEVQGSNMAVNADLGADTSGQVALNGAALTLYLADNSQLDTLNVANTGNSVLTMGSSAAGQLRNLGVSGEGELTLAGSTLGSSLADTSNISFNASAFAGDLTVESDVLKNAVYVTGGSGNDNLGDLRGAVAVEADAGNDFLNLYHNRQDATVNAGAGDDTVLVSSANATINGGEGNDTLIVDGVGGELPLPFFDSVFTNFETLQFTSNVTVNTDEFDGISNVVLAQRGTVANLDSDQTVTALSGSMTAEDSNLVLIDAAEQVNVVSQFSGQEAFLELVVNASQAEGQGGNLSLSGTGSVQYSDTGRNFDTVDATGLQGGLTFGATAYAQETVALGSGADTMNVAGGSTVANIDLITGFNASNDTLDLASGEYGSIAVTQVSTQEEMFDTIASASAANGNGYVAFEFDQSLFIYADNDGVAGVTDGDFAIEFADVQGIDLTPDMNVA